MSKSCASCEGGALIKTKEPDKDTHSSIISIFPAQQHGTIRARV